MADALLDALLPVMAAHLEREQAAQARRHSTADPFAARAARGGAPASRSERWAALVRRRTPARALLAAKWAGREPERAEVRRSLPVEHAVRAILDLVAPGGAEPDRVDRLRLFSGIQRALGCCCDEEEEEEAIARADFACDSAADAVFDVADLWVDSTAPRLLACFLGVLRAGLAARRGKRYLVLRHVADVQPLGQLLPLVERSLHREPETIYAPAGRATLRAADVEVPRWEGADSVFLAAADAQLRRRPPPLLVPSDDDDDDDDEGELPALALSPVRVVRQPYALDSSTLALGMDDGMQARLFACLHPELATAVDAVLRRRALSRQKPPLVAPLQKLSPSFAPMQPLRGPPAPARARLPRAERHVPAFLPTGARRRVADPVSVPRAPPSPVAAAAHRSAGAVKPARCDFRAPPRRPPPTFLRAAPAGDSGSANLRGLQRHGRLAKSEVDLRRLYRNRLL